MVNKRLKYAIFGLIGVLLVVAVWGVASSLVESGRSTAEIVQEEQMGDKKDAPVVGENYGREEYETARGTRLKQEGTYEEKAVQCVYDFFKYEMPESDLVDAKYELQDLEDGNYCVKVGDWYAFVKGEYNVCYIYRFCKDSELTEYEMEYVKNNGIELSESGGVYSWEH